LLVLDDALLDEVAVVADDVVALDADWLCAWISALMVSGEICDEAPVVDDAVELVDASEPVRASNALPPALRDLADADFDEPSDCRLSKIDDATPDAAPSANNMAILPHRPHTTRR
jgi:hypothetical protein